VIGDGNDTVDVAARQRDAHPCLTRSDPFDTASREHRLAAVGHVEQPELEARAAEVGDQDLHRDIDQRKNVSAC
jgi:hypothetical protein